MVSFPKNGKSGGKQVNIEIPDDIEQQRAARRKNKPRDTQSRDGQSSTATRHKQVFGTGVIVLLILLLGAATSAALLAVGITSAKSDVLDRFERRSEDLVNQVERAWEDYETAASWIHGRCRGRNFTRSEFRDVYEYLINSGLDFQAAQFDPNITDAERPAAEEEARLFYQQNYPHINYRGFVGFNYANSTTLDPRNRADYYFPIHYMEPVVGNEPAIDLDYHASGSRKRTVLFCMNEGKPALTDRLRLVQETTESAFGVVLMHPGFELTNPNQTEPWPHDLASIVIRIPDLIRRAGKDQRESSAVYIYDNSDSSGEPLFLGAAKIVAAGNERDEAELEFLMEKTIEDVRAITGELQYERAVAAANKEWIVSIHSLPGTYDPDLVFVILGAVIIFLASVFLAAWVRYNTRKVLQMNRMRADAEQEKAALIIDNARQATKAERELNDFIAHEVRNPVAAAMSACSFVKTALSAPRPLTTDEARDETREDIEIIDNALRFVNDLLRNMLDMHRAANKQLKVHMTPTDIKHDVLEPVAALLPQRDTKFQIEVECADQLHTITDRLRLKQVVLNLARNSVKFIDQGFIRLKAEVVDGNVFIYVEDSGPGIPEEKKDLLFAKFQESLDSLSQGTGIGLFLCKNLVELMGGEISLDRNFHSGMDGFPGTRFVVNLKQESVDQQVMDEYHSESASDFTELSLAQQEVQEVMRPHDLPESLSVLFVDDDPILRKLFTRTVRTVAPDWNIREASNGETALNLVDEHNFDLIFMDMYMASVEKQLLGTETVRALRNKGVKCRICGLSANDKEEEFLDAGANVFTFKPFPCEKRALTNELCRVLFDEDEEDKEEHDQLLESENTHAA